MVSFLRPADLVAALLVGLADGSARAEGPWFQGIGVVAEGARSNALGVSDDGVVVVGTDLDEGHVSRTPIRWEAGAGLVALPVPPSTFATARAVSGDGTRIVGLLANFVFGEEPVMTAQAGFHWTDAGGSALLTDLADPEVRSGAYAVSQDGSVVVGALGDADASHAVYWTAGEVHAIDGLPSGAIRSVAWGVTRDGATIVGSAETAGGTEAFRWTAAAGATPLADLAEGALLCEAIAVSDDGSVVVGVASDARGRRAVRWVDGGSPQDLGDLPGGSLAATAVDVSADGGTVVGRADTDGTEPLQRAFLWTEAHGMRELRTVLADLGLDLDGWDLIAAQGITPDGRTVVGTGLNPDAVLEGWIAYLPEPRSGALAGAALAALTTLARARRPAARRIR